jgi:hypothetical protein
MDKALVYGTRDSGFDPQWSRFSVLIFIRTREPKIPPWSECALKVINDGSYYEYSRLIEISIKFLFLSVAVYFLF